MRFQHTRIAGGGTSGYIYEAVRETTVIERGVEVVGVSLFSFPSLVTRCRHIYMCLGIIVDNGGLC